MEMKNPVHPGVLVKECLDDLGLSVAEAARGAWRYTPAAS